MRGQDNQWLHRQKIPQRLRRAMTEAERHLWRHLRLEQMGVKFRRQHPYGDYVLDFVSLDIGLVVEVDGGQHEMQMERDQQRTAALQQAGFQVLHFWNSEIFRQMEGVLTAIRLAIADARKTHPHPVPPLEGEGTN